MSPPSAWDAGDGPAGPVDDRHHVRVAVVDAVRNRPEVAADPERLDGYLRDVCPLQPAEVAVVVVAARAGVAEELAQAGAGHHAESTAARVAKRLNSESGIDHGLARWAVDTWAMAVGATALLPAARPTDPGPRAPADPAPPAPALPPATLLPTLGPSPAPGAAPASEIAEASAPADIGEDAEVLHAMVVPPPAPEAPAPPEAPTARPADSVPPASPPIDEQPGRTLQRPPKPAPAPAAASPDGAGRRRARAIGAGGAAAGALVIALVFAVTGGGSDTESRTSPTTLEAVTASPPVTTAASVTSSTLAPSTTVTAAPRPFPSEQTSLTPGVYASAAFEPRLTATLGDGWKLNAQSPVHLELTRADSGTELVTFLRSPRPLRRDRIFTNFEDAARTTATEPPPADLITWLRADSRFRVSAATPATTGGVQGVQVDVTIPSGTTMTLCGQGCVPLFQLDNVVFVLNPGSINRIYVLPVLGHELVIVIEAHADRFGAFVEQADRLVDTVAFKG